MAPPVQPSVGAGMTETAQHASCRSSAVLGCGWQRRDSTGGGLSNGNHRYAHLGLGDAAEVEVPTIEWPSGIVQEFKNVPARQILTVTEPPRLIPEGTGAFRIR